VQLTISVVLDLLISGSGSHLPIHSFLFSPIPPCFPFPSESVEMKVV